MPLLNSVLDMKNINNTMAHSAECLRKAVPLMVKYNIAVTPANYALWYTYVSGKHPKLNDKLNTALKTFSTCPPALSRELFDEFLSEKDLELYDEVTSNINQLVVDFQTDVGLTLNSTKEFSDTLNECNNDLDNMQPDKISTNDILSMVSKLSEESKAMQNSAAQFQSKLETAHLEISRLRNELEQTQQEAHKDALTGLLNRRSFDEDIQLLCKSTSTSLILFLTFIDIDHFKHFNDNYGHQAGDGVLKSVADQLIKKASELNTPYRFGGEEFCILSQAKNITEAKLYAEMLRCDVESIRFKSSKSKEKITVTASFGIAQYDADLPVSLIEKADKALYKAKETGRNKVEIFKP